MTCPATYFLHTDFYHTKRFQTHWWSGDLPQKFRHRKIHWQWTMNVLHIFHFLRY